MTISFSLKKQHCTGLTNPFLFKLSTVVNLL
jgi:hypothetical protein